MRFFKSLTDKARKKAEGIKRAVAVSLPPGKNRVPVAVAKGEGQAAEEILKLAREHDVPVREDPELAALLMGLETGQEIPVELYRALAAIFACLKSFDDQKAGAPSALGAPGSHGAPPSYAPISTPISTPTGQWSEPMTSGAIQAALTDGTSGEEQKK